MYICILFVLALFVSLILSVIQLLYMYLTAIWPQAHKDVNKLTGWAD